GSGRRDGGRRGTGSGRRDGSALAPLIVPRWLPITSVALVLIGLALSVYLTYEHYTASATLACSDNGVVNCLQVTTSAQSKVFGIPVALLGLIYFVAMLPACLPAAWRSRSPWLRNGRIAAGVVGIGFVFYLLYSELFTIGKICLYCTGVHVVTVALFAVVLFGQASVTAPEDR
ncbi:MAG TPA: vitamin K epoxide reductase family protein, partial [Micromonosporaceae bacterium]